MKLSDTQCWRIQKLLLQGEAWTRKAWLSEPMFLDKNPRIVVIKLHFKYHGNTLESQDQYWQIWDGAECEPRLNMFRYMPCDEDWRATDWIRVDTNGIPTGELLSDIVS